MRKNHLKIITTCCVWTLLLSGFSEPVIDPPALRVGDPAPPFHALNQDGEPWRLEDCAGKYVVIYFYPAAMTGGCTKQACSYRDAMDQGNDLDLEVVGISGDVPKNLKYFQKENNLNFTLLSDADGQIANLFGVPVKAGSKSIQRTVDGQNVTLERSNTTARWTFIIDRQGNVARINPKVKAAEDSTDAIEFIRSLNQ